jgi:hypothetical protein
VCKSVPSSCPLTPEFPFYLELTTVSSPYGLYNFTTVPYSVHFLHNCPSLVDTEDGVLLLEQINTVPVRSPIASAVECAFRNHWETLDYWNEPFVISHHRDDINFLQVFTAF